MLRPTAPQGWRTSFNAFNTIREIKIMTLGNVRAVSLAVALIGCVPFSQPSAQMYRCGSAYQDRPCDGAQAGKQVTPGGKAGNAPATSPTAAAHPECTQRGADSQKIVWSRENGETEEKMSAAESGPARKKLIADVYRVRGSAPQVRTRIEAECQTEMAEKAKALVLYESMVQAGVAPAQKTAPAASSAAEREAEAAQRAQNVAQSEAVEKKSKCDRLLASRESILGQQRAGGSSSQVDNLNRQRATVDRDIQDKGCSRMK